MYCSCSHQRLALFSLLPPKSSTSQVSSFPFSRLVSIGDWRPDRTSQIFQLFSDAPLLCYRDEEAVVSGNSILFPVIVKAFHLQTSSLSYNIQSVSIMSEDALELGCKISLISKAGIRYEGRLFTVDPDQCTIALSGGKYCFFYAANYSLLLQ